MITSIILNIVKGFVLSPGSGVVVPLDELLELSLLDQFLYLLFQIATFINVMAVILMKTTVFLRVTFPRGRAQWFGPL